jgi:hypothetical protein
MKSESGSGSERRSGSDIKTPQSFEGSAALRE